jgi:hypothetical protein
MFPWKDFLIGWITKIQKHKEERDKSEKFKKQEGKNGGKKKKRLLSVLEDSHTHVFSIDRQCPQATALMRPSLRRTHSYVNLPYNKITLCESKFNISWVKCVEYRPCSGMFLKQVPTEAGAKGFLFGATAGFKGHKILLFYFFS